MNERIDILFHKLEDGTASEAELQEFFNVSLDEKQTMQLNALLDKGWDELYEEGKMVRKTTPSLKIRAHRVFFMPRRWWAAAAVLIVLGTATWFLIPKSIDKRQVAVVTDIKPPASNRATIKLASGEIVYLDSAGKGAIATQDKVILTKLGDGSIAYKEKGNSTTVQYNTLSNPRGSKLIDMTLADGSRVWLNAGSTITYPVAFVGDERKVTVTGEAYFEVTHNAAMPFKVSKGETEVTVLGTHFNVNAYDDEGDIKVTLLEGSVRVAQGSQTKMLKPGQQAVVKATQITLDENADTEMVMAWKNGLFLFKETDMASMLRQVGRWYDVEIVFAGKVPGWHVVADIPRSFTMLQLMEGLQQFGIKTKLDGRILTVE